MLTITLRNRELRADELEKIPRLRDIGGDTSQIFGLTAYRAT